MANLWCNGQLLAEAEVAGSRALRRRGLLGRNMIAGVFVLPNCRAVHTIGMRMPIDVAHVSRSNKVLRIRTIPPGRIGRPVLRAGAVMEAAAGAFTNWGVSPGDVLEIR